MINLTSFYTQKIKDFVHHLAVLTVVRTAEIEFLTVIRTGHEAAVMKCV